MSFFNDKKTFRTILDKFYDYVFYKSVFFLIGVLTLKK